MSRSCRSFWQGVADQLERLGVKRGDVVHAGVPGALEIPLALQWMAQSGHFDALVAVGVVIRGETYHFEIVANESARGVMQVALELGCRWRNAILTTKNEAQAQARVDKAAEAVRVASRWRGCASTSRSTVRSGNAVKTARRRAREIALQALYAWQLGGRRHGRRCSSRRTAWKAMSAPMRRSCRRWSAAASSVRSARRAHRAASDRAQAEPVLAVERAILRIGTLELSERPETPVKVVLNEAIELGKDLAVEQGHRFVNGVLERVAQAARPGEFARLRQTA